MRMIQIIASNLYANSNLKVSNDLFKFLSIGLSKDVKFNYLGVIQFYEGDIFAAINYFIRQLKITPSYPSAYANLAFVSSFYGDDSSKQYVIEQIDKFFPENKKLLKLKLSLMLSLNRELAKKTIHSVYIDQWVKKSTIHSSKKTVLLFHIPKCGGTTITDSLYNYYYKSEEPCIPNYFESDLLHYCIEEIPDAFSFLSTRHIPLKDLKLSLPDFYSITCLRDPLKRSISAFRQTRSGNKNGRFFKIVPRYGSHWNTGKIRSFKDWLDHVPLEELNHQLSTFSAQMEASDFLSTVEKIDHLMFLENFQYGQSKLFQQLGIKELKKDVVKKKLNQSSKKIKISSEEIAYAKEKLKEEEQAIRKIKINDT